MTIVGGRIVVEDGRSTTVDEDEVIARATAASHGLIERCGLDGLLVPWRR